MTARFLTTWQWLPLPRPDVFAFFAEAANLERITPPFLRFHVLTPPPIVLRTGARIDYRLTLRGIPLRWRTEITAWDPPQRFADVQLRGPYAEWIHTHTFEEQDNGTMVRDEVRYRLWGPHVLGTLVDRLLVAPDTTRIFQFRQRALEQILGVKGRARCGPVVLSSKR